MSGRRVRIVSYNVHACIGRDRRFMPDRIAAVLEELDADFVALQEVEDRPYRGMTVTEYLADRLGMHAHRGATLYRGDAHYGNLLLAREAAVAHRLHDISVGSREPRGAIEADFEAGGRTLKIFVTHLGLRAGERRRQIRRLLPALDRGEADVQVLAGDINEWRPGAAASRLLTRSLGPVPLPRTFPAGAPLFALDRLYVTPRDVVVRVDAVRTRDARQASDHLPLVADLRMPTG
ncbi:endonuclease/exonuclease/phosphatase family protein [Lentisalinibacter salinarum]|uniref:endonuclease/exonuclease/phosphatase family protein n=1 Tax=Lentisalinibacter salinarum TaxID=2992239 RepID=UPI003867BA20